ncbi:MAG: hypothetical protein HYW51_01555 [Candidatus Doudnabacteria bacterium]|nr:hypothetical protein [Candidatus Doudnabacteria bacterium]
MLAEFLSSKQKSKLVNLFLSSPKRSFSYTELRQTTKCPSKLLHQTIKELTKLEFLLSFQKGRHKFFQINKHFALYPELIGLIKKQKQIPKDLLVKQASKIGDCKFAALTGVFAGRPRMETDVLFVGKVSPMRLKRFLKLAEKFAEGDVGYTIFSSQEFEYRKIMNDRFIKNILENNPVIVVDKTSKKKSRK